VAFGTRVETRLHLPLAEYIARGLLLDWRALGCQSAQSAGSARHSRTIPTVMAAGVSARLWSVEDLVAAIDARNVKADMGEMLVG
jgi:hypothetical protein